MLSPAQKIIILLVVNSFNVLYILTHLKDVLSPRTSLIQEESYTWRAHDFPEHFLLPSAVEMVPVTVEESVHYPPLGADNDEEWLSIATWSWGYVRLGPEDRTFVVSMFHELHCLRVLNMAFSKSSGTGLPHVRHCLNYIRQNVLCNPDLALEPDHFEERDFEVERTWGTHMCKNWDLIYQQVDENYFPWAERAGWEPHHSHSHVHSHS